MVHDTDNMDDSSIRPVSSLRSQFESMSTFASRSKPISSRGGSPVLKTQPDNGSDTSSRMSLDLPRKESPWAPDGRQDQSPRALKPTGAAILRPLLPGTRDRPRPVSTGPWSPPHSPPSVKVDAPKSPPRQRVTASLHPPGVLHAPTKSVIPAPGDSSASQLSTSQLKSPDERKAGHVDPRTSPFLSASEAMALPEEMQPLSETGRSSPRTKAIPPPVNRADKPKIGKLPSLNTERPSSGALTPSATQTEEKVSPFSTPPSSDEDSKISHELPQPRHVSTTSIPDLTLPEQKSFQPPPLHPLAQAQRQRQKSQASSKSSDHSSPRANPSSPAKGALNIPEERPGLPPRRDAAAISSSPSRPSSRRASPAAGAGAGRESTRAAPISAPALDFLPPPRRSNTGEPPPPNEARFRPPARSFTSNPDKPGLRDVQARPEPATLSHERTEPSTYPDPLQGPTTAPPQGLTEYPDSSQANRRHPCFRTGIREIPTRDARLMAVSGQYACTAGQLTRAWDLADGSMSMGLFHGETVRVTSIAFKPSADLESEGSHLWVGTNFGDIHEIDIAMQAVVGTKSGAHSRREVIKIYRHANELWTLDDDGKLQNWPPDNTGLPDVAVPGQSFRVTKGHTCSVVAGDYLWYATGKDIRIFYLSTDSTVQFQVLARPLSQAGVGEVTSGAVLSSQPDRIYFGHNDGKVTIYSLHDYMCLGIVNVSLYKISALAGVGDYLWAGFNTGMIYVYDTTTNPWRVKKDWQAHDSPILSIVMDRSSIWKLGRLQVASLGTDNFLRIWDGMLEDDWLETELQHHDVDYCEFRETKALIMTWNAGASVPQSLRQDQMDNNFFRELLQSADVPEILVFGFQELVDLEDKKVTAKSFFKSSKKKDSTEQEHMSRQYRAWRDHLSRSIEDAMPPDMPYQLLHTANLVGLFTCVFVRDSLRKNIRHVAASEVKRGMGGLHGNKGALVVRLVLDDSSLCFVNCHLAAGQTQTTHRNNDLASILETAALPEERDAATRIDTFVGGGDGTMILDHEICILNGDLNYRIDSMTRDTVVSAVKANNLTKLLDRDQLLLSRKRNPGFRLRAFNEGPIDFAPTYKYDVGTDRYDTSEKKRAPAWCDRILYRGLGRVKLLGYRRHEVRVSDHRPVSALFKFRVKTISPKKRIAVWEQCQQKFEAVKQQMAYQAELDYLVNVCGYDERHSRKMLE